MKRLTIPFLVLAAVASGASYAAPPSLKEILRPAQHRFVSISPDGSHVAATVRKDDKDMLAIVNRSTLKPERVLDPEEKGAIARVEWASDHRILVMNSRVGDVVEQAYLEPYVVAINVDGSDKRVLGSWIVDTLRDDDEHILVAHCGRGSSKGCWPYVQKVDTEGHRNGPRVADAPALNASFLSDSKGEVRFSYVTDEEEIQRLWMRDGEGWKLINDESASGVEVVALGFSRDGRYGYLLSERTAGPDVVERIDMSTGTREVVMSDPRLDPDHIVWSADQREPIGAAYGPGVPRARFWDDSHPDAKLIRQLEMAFPEDAVQIVSGSRDGLRLIVSVSSDRDPGSFYLLDRPTLKTGLIARVQPWISPDQLSPAKPVTFKARDGKEISGYLTLPIAPAGAKPPLVVLPHGGPFFVRDDWFYEEETQILAAHGYAVLRVNYRGSSGYGRDFSVMGFRQYGLKMQDDLTDATRWVMQNERVDASRVCIWGSSYGGYAALMGAAREPELYRCAISTAGLTDLNTHWKWGDTHRSRYGRNYLEETMGSDSKVLLQASPVTYAGQMKPAIMLVHGVHDPRVDFEHARRMKEALDKAGKPYEGYFPKDETHGIYGEENRVEYYTKVLDFLAVSLGGRRAQE